MVFNQDYENIIRWFHVGWWVRREKWFSKQKNMDNITQEPWNNHTHICIHKPNRNYFWPASLVDQQVTCLNRMSFPLGCQEDSYLTDRLHRRSFGKMPLFNVLEIISLQFNKIKSSFQNLVNEQKMHFGSNQTRVLLKETRECFNYVWASSTGANATSICRVLRWRLLSFTTVNTYHSLIPRNAN